MNKLGGPAAKLAMASQKSRWTHRQQLPLFQRLEKRSAGAIPILLGPLAFRSCDGSNTGGELVTRIEHLDGEGVSWLLSLVEEDRN